MNFLGIREPEIYGKKSYNDLVLAIETHAKKLGIEAVIKQSNHEGDLIDWIQEAYNEADGIVLNSAAYTHTSIAIRDAILSVNIPVIEVHLSDIDRREDFRCRNFVRDVCAASFVGLGFDGYLQAMEALCALSEKA